MTLRAVSATMTQAVEETLAALDLTDADSAAARLAREYASAIDRAYQQGTSHDGKDAHAWAIRWIGPPLLDTLTALGATPLARDRMKDGDKGSGTPDALDELRAVRAKRSRP